MFKPVGRGRLADQITSQIREKVFSGALMKGERLPAERELARHFNASPIVLREALHTLKAEGLLEIRSGALGGAFVSQPTHLIVSERLSTLLQAQGTTIEQLTEARLLLEPGIAGLVAKKRSEEDIKILNENVSLTRSSKRSIAVRSVDNVAFHRMLAAATLNPVLIANINSIMDNFVFDLGRGNLRGSVASRITCEHGEILEAICDCDHVRAHDLMRTHIQEIGVQIAQRKDGGP
jgi:GntR family transcriptional regulator, transcriptional repressor for pyruvate dehydrogenase complex